MCGQRQVKHDMDLRVGERWGQKLEREVVSPPAGIITLGTLKYQIRVQSSNPRFAVPQSCKHSQQTESGVWFVADVETASAQFM